MKNLTGITLNGEWLGNNVLINGMFRSICTISPKVMQEFIHIINGIDELDDAVAIQNYNCKDKNSIDIEFANKDISGLASLYFAMNDGDPELINSFLKLNRNEDGAFSEGAEDAMDALEENVNKKSKKSKKKSRRNRDVEAGNFDGYTEEGCSESNSEYNEGYAQSYQEPQQYNEYGEPVNNYYPEAPAYQQGYANDGYQDYGNGYADNYGAPNAAGYQEPYFPQGAAVNIYANDNCNGDPYSEQQINNNYRNNNVDDSEYEIEEIQEEVEEEVVNEDGEVVTVKKNRTKKVKKAKDGTIVDFDENEENDEEDDDNESSPRARANRPAGMRPQNNMRGGGRPGRPMPPMPPAPNAQGRGQGRVSASSDLQQIVITANSINIKPSDFEQDGRGSRRHGRDNAEGGVDEERKSKRARGEKGDAETSADKASTTEETIEPTKREIIIPEIINENYNPEDISEFLADFYTSDKIEAEISREQALLDEIESLKEEINNLHGQHRNPEEEDETPMTLEEFYARQLKKESKANTYGYTFKIVGTNKRIRANVLDPELFIAGDKLYRWGEKLYLEF